MKKFEEYLVKRIDKNKNYAGLLEYPSYVEIETVNACNARCPMCTINDWKRNYPVMRDNVFNKISEDLIDNKKYVKRVSLYRDGEPLIDKKLAARIAKFKDNGIDFIDGDPMEKVIDLDDDNLSTLGNKSLDIIDSWLDRNLGDLLVSRIESISS